MKLPTIKDLNQGKWDNHFTFSIKNLGSFEFDYEATEPTFKVDDVNYHTVVRRGNFNLNSLAFYFDDDSEPIADNHIKDSSIYELLMTKFSEHNVIHEETYNFYINF
jgi:hypothetical protein